MFAWWPVAVAALEAVMLIGLLIGALYLVKRLRKGRTNLSFAFLDRKRVAVSKDAPTGMSDEDTGVQIPFGKERRLGLFPGYVKVEMTRIKSVPTEKGTYEKRRVVTARYLVHRRVKIFVAKLGIPNMAFGAFILDPSALNSEGKVVYDEQIAEPYQPNGAPPMWSRALDIIMANAFVGAAIEVSTTFAGFVFGRPQLYVLLVSAFIGGFAMWSIAPIFGWFPTTAIHWVTSPPVIK